ncbi:helix-turn-helix domain-containing protein [Actinomadura soli]|uniref:Helix-turn-helix domain-containing protein n=1 Tax=Actinomadura soli TaxID=2508997 RepID=A0A5C4J6Z9_9ACTN|nr:helix-turn-helix transcriptional regulator [Actinomadura soli]TMQ92807.1 helix-turn-helix domain-containing protein [Actinomadura soli]
MNVNESPDPRLNLWATIAFFLRFFRMQQGQTGDTVARWLNRSRSSISRLESGESQLKESEAAILDAKWNTGGLFGVLLWFARLGHDPNWNKNYLAFEARSSEIRMYDGQLVPAPFQTPDYARALLMAGRAKNLEKAVEARMARRAILHKPDAPEVWVLIAETVLGPHVGGRDVMREQIAHLIELSQLPHVILRIVPNSAGANEGLDGPFKVLKVKEGEIGFLEAPNGGRLELDAEEVAGLRKRFDRIGAIALPVEMSRALLKDAMEHM